jgi:predicted nucleic acid-binding Zn ribbon protein
MLIKDINNIWSAYNKDQNFRMLVVAEDENEAYEIAKEYGKDAGIDGEFEITTADINAHYDCDYILTANDKTKSNDLPMLSAVDDNNKAEFIGQIIEIFEDFLDSKEIILDNPERDEDEDLDPETAANIYGSDYGEIQTNLENMFEKWNMVNRKLVPIEEEYKYDKFGFIETLAVRYHCPTCNNILNAGPNYRPTCCDKCGQLINFDKIVFKADKFLKYKPAAKPKN